MHWYNDWYIEITKKPFYICIGSRNLKPSSLQITIYNVYVTGLHSARCLSRQSMDVRNTRQVSPS